MKTETKEKMENGMVLGFSLLLVLIMVVFLMSMWNLSDQKYYLIEKCNKTCHSKGLDYKMDFQYDLPFNYSGDCYCINKSCITKQELLRGI